MICRLNLSVKVFGVLFLACLAPSAFGQGNLVANPSFEEVDAGKVAHWSCEGDAGVKQILSSDVGVTTGKSAKLDCVTFARQTRDSYSTLVQTGFSGIEKGKWYRFSCWARQEGMAPGMVTVELTADMHAVIPYTTGLLFKQLPVRNTWQRFENYFEATCAGTDSSRLAMYFDLTGTLWIDDVEIVETAAPHPEFTDVTPPTTARNLVRNSSFECGPDLWTSVGKKLGWSGGLTGLFGEIQAADAVDGANCLRIELGPGKTQDSTFNFGVVCVKQDAPLATNMGWIKVAKGKPYTLSVYMKADSAGIPAKLRFRFGAPMGTPLDRDFPVLLGKEWTRYSQTLPAESEYLCVAAGPDLSQTPEAAATVWIDAVQLEQGDSPGVYVRREPVELGLNTGKYGNVFDLGDKLAITIQSSNASAVPSPVGVHMELRDYFDRVVSSSSGRIDCPGQQSIATEWSLGIQNPGFYRADFSWDANGIPNTRSLRLAVINPCREEDSTFGMNHAPSTNEVCALYRKAGLLWAREWAMEWQRIEPSPGKFEFAMADRHINRVLGAGMKMVQQLPPFPSADWNSSAPEGADKIAPKYPWNLCFYPPKDPEVFKTYASTVVGHFKDRFNTWEYLNEPLYTIHSLPNSTQMDATVPGLPNANYTVNDYVALLKVFYSTVKQADPTAKTIGGLGARPDLLAKEFFEADGLKYLDVFNLHIYPGLRRPEGYIPQMEELLANMDRNGGRKPIWMTEYCYYGADSMPWEPYVVGPGPWAANRLLRSERECADYAVRYAAIMLAHGVEKIFYHWGGAASSEAGDDLVLIESWMNAYGGLPRKAYAAQANLTSMLGSAPKFSAVVEPPVTRSGASEVYGYAFQCGERSLVIAWAPAEDNQSSTWSIKAPADIKAFDIVGAPIDSADIRLGESPVYLASTALPAPELASGCAFILHSPTGRE